MTFYYFINFPNFSPCFFFFQQILLHCGVFLTAFKIHLLAKLVHFHSKFKSLAKSSTQHDFCHNVFNLLRNNFGALFWEEKFNNFSNCWPFYFFLYAQKFGKKYVFKLFSILGREIFPFTLWIHYWIFPFPRVSSDSKPRHIATVHVARREYIRSSSLNCKRKLTTK